MAKKPKTPKPKSTKRDGQEVKAGDVMKMPPANAIISLAKDVTAANKQKAGISEELSEIIAEMKKTKGIHPGALKRVEGWLTKAKATDRGLAAVATELAHLDFYRDVLGLTKMIEEQGQMFARPEAGEGGGDEDETEKVTPLFPAAGDAKETEQVH